MVVVVVEVVVVPFFYPLFFCFQPNSQATKRARPQKSEARPSASLRSEKAFQKFAKVLKFLKGSFFKETRTINILNIVWANTQYECDWVRNNENSSGETYVGDVESRDECIDMVREACPDATIANVRWESYIGGVFFFSFWNVSVTYTGGKKN